MMEKTWMLSHKERTRHLPSKHFINGLLLVIITIINYKWVACKLKIRKQVLFSLTYDITMENQVLYAQSKRSKMLISFPDIWAVLNVHCTWINSSEADN